MRTQNPGSATPEQDPNNGRAEEPNGIATAPSTLDMWKVRREWRDPQRHTKGIQFCQEGVLAHAKGGLSFTREIRSVAEADSSG